jgi:hypothetical protein
MSQLIYLGAINKITCKYVYPTIANKKDTYTCPDCNKEVILVQGKILRHHFRHKTDKVEPCRYYDKPTESQIHKDSKLLLKTLLENNISMQFMRKCVSCKISYEIELPEITVSSTITLEHRFNYEDELKIADVAHICDDEIEAIYEICHTHHTSSEDRPEPWVEIDAGSLLTSVHTNNDRLTIQCIRREKCKWCDCSICGGTGVIREKKCLGKYQKNPCPQCNCCDCGKWRANTNRFNQCAPCEKKAIIDGLQSDCGTCGGGGWYCGTQNRTPCWDCCCVNCSKLKCICVHGLEDTDSD